MVDGANLLNALTGAIRQYVVLDDGAADPVALWVLHTHALEALHLAAARNHVRGDAMRQDHARGRSVTVGSKCAHNGQRHSGRNF